MLSPIPKSPIPRMMKLPDAENGIAIIPRIKSFPPMRNALSANAKIHKYAVNMQIATLNSTANNAASRGIAIGVAQIASRAIFKVPFRKGLSDTVSSSSFLSS